MEVSMRANRWAGLLWIWAVAACGNEPGPPAGDAGSPADAAESDGGEVDAALPTDGGGAPPVAFVELPGSGGFRYDDLRYSTRLGRIIVAARSRGVVALVDPETLAVETIDVAGDAASADEGGGTVYAL